MNKLLCIYHANCDDGFAAAWAVRHHLGEENVEFHPGVYGQDPPDVTDRKVMIVDFSYKRPVLEKMAETAAKILVLDHHKTAAEDLAGLPYIANLKSFDNLHTFENTNKLSAVFDMHRSGAGLTWDWLTGKPRPRFIDYVEDRDLWTKRLPGVDEFTMALRSYPMTFEAWDKLFDYNDAVPDLIGEGRTIMRYYRARVEEFKPMAYLGTLGGRRCAVVNGTFSVASDLAGEIIDKFPGDAEFGVVWFEEQKGWFKYSLRSRDGLADVSEIAKQFGGGGHRNAAGFTSQSVVHS